MKKSPKSAAKIQVTFTYPDKFVNGNYIYKVAGKYIVKTGDKNQAEKIAYARLLKKDLSWDKKVLLVDFK